MTRDLFTVDHNERAVSPVIGVILMVAITVILAAVIGTFVLGLGQDMSQTAPTAQLYLEDSEDTGNFTLVHNGGDSINLDDTTVLTNGSTATPTPELSGTLKAGENLEVNVSDTGPTEIKLRHDPSEAIIAQGTIDLS